MNKTKKMQNIKKMFNEKAKQYDKKIIKILPFYNDMLEALINALPFDKSKKITICDLGCGTGNVSALVKKRFKNAKIVCIDMSENMINMTQTKFKNHKDVTYIVKDFYNLKFNQKFDAIVSSLALHHLVTDKDKIAFYKKIYNTLKKNGVFYNADVMLGNTKYLEDLYMKQWIKFMRKNFKEKEVKMYVNTRNSEDVPVPIETHITGLKRIGFKNIDIIWKYYNTCVYGGIKK